MKKVSIFKTTQKRKKLLIGWTEWCALPQFHIGKIRAKIDTGAKTSALHAEGLNIINSNGNKIIEFKILPHQNDNYAAKICHAKLIDHRYVMSSNGIKEKRYVIETPLIIGGKEFLTEITLTDRTLLNYRMIIGRTSLSRFFLIDPNRTHIQKLPKYGDS